VVVVQFGPIAVFKVWTTTHIFAKFGQVCRTCDEHNNLLKLWIVRQMTSKGRNKTTCAGRGGHR
jgi:hypothetical protein